MRRYLSRAVTALILLIFFIPVAVIASEITVYTSYEEDEAAAFLATMKRDLPDLKVNLLRLSTGDLHARMLAESANPRHDVIWGWAVT